MTLAEETNDEEERLSAAIDADDAEAAARAIDDGARIGNGGMAIYSAIANEAHSCLKMMAERVGFERIGTEGIRYALACGNPDSIRTLLAAGSPLHDVGGEPILQAAARNASNRNGMAERSLECLAVLAEADKDRIDMREDLNGHSPLHLAIGNPEAARVLLEAGANPDAPDFGGETPLHRAARIGREGSADMLLRHGADPNASDGRGVAPLHIAVTEEDRRMVMTLLSHGADPSAKTRAGMTAIDFARSRSPEIRQLVESAAERKILEDAAARKGVAQQRSERSELRI